MVDRASDRVVTLPERPTGAGQHGTGMGPGQGMGPGGPGPHGSGMGQGRRMGPPDDTRAQ